MRSQQAYRRRWLRRQKQLASRESSIAYTFEIAVSYASAITETISASASSDNVEIAITFAIAVTATTGFVRATINHRDSTKSACNRPISTRAARQTRHADSSSRR